MKGKKTAWKIIMIELLLAGIFSFLFYSFQRKVTQDNVYLEVNALITQDDQFQLFYTDTIAYDQSHSFIVNVTKSNDFQNILFILPKDSIIRRFRLDPGNKPGNILIHSIRLVSSQKEYKWGPDSILKNFIANEFVELSEKGEHLLLKRHGLDPHIFLNKDIKDIYQDIVQSVSFHSRLAPAAWSIGLFLIIFICLRITQYSSIIFQWLIQPSYSLLLIFLLFISLPLLNLIFPLIPEFMDYEKRDKKPFPEYNLVSLTSYPDRFTEYFNDNFSFRSLLTKLNSYFKTQVLCSSPLPDKVLLGKDNWLFLSDGFDANYSADPLLPEQDLNGLYNSLAQRTRLLKSQGIDYYVLILPDKSIIYPEYLPRVYQQRNVHARMDQLMAKLAMDTLIKVIDPRALLLQEKKKRELYYSSDTHWNIYASMLVYDELIKIIRKNHPDISTRAFSRFNFIEQNEEGGDLGDLMNVPELYRKKVVFPRWENEKATFDMKETRVKYLEGFTHINHDKPNGKKILLYHDSFGLFFIKRLEEDFKESAFYWKHDFSSHDIDEHKPDIVVHEIVTRFIPNLKE